MRHPAAFPGIAALLLLTAIAPASAQPLTLREALVRAGQQSPGAQAARARVSAAEAAADAVARLPNPMVELRSENWTALARDTFAVVTQPIELGGRLAGRRSAARAATDTATAAAGVTGQALGRLVVQRYVEALRARGARDALAAQRDSLVEIVRVLTERTQAGAAAEADLHKFDSERARVDTQIVRADVQLAAALRRLDVLAGATALGPTDIVVPDLPPLDAAPAGLAAAIERRPDVIAARARLSEAQAMLAIARARGVPELLVTGGYKRTAGVNTGVAAVAMAVPLFDRNGAAVATADGDVRAAELELAFVRGQALADAEAQLAAARRLAGHAAAIERDQVEPATVVRSAARAAFDEGAGDILQLVDAERVLADARRDVLDIRLDALLAAIEARLALGQEPLP